MSIAYDATSAATTGTGNLSWTHTPVGTPKGVIVFIVQNVGATDEVTTVTYGGKTMREVAGSPLLASGGEPGAVYAYHLGTGIPTGAQTVAVTVNATGSSKAAQAYTVTAASDVDLTSADASINSTSLANPSVVLALSGFSSFVAIGFHSGQGTAASITPLASWTSSAEVDFGNQMAGFYKFDTIGTADVTCGWTQTADDARMIAVALRETVSSGVDSWSLTEQPKPSIALSTQTDTATETDTGAVVTQQNVSGTDTASLTEPTTADLSYAAIQLLGTLAESGLAASSALVTELLSLTESAQAATTLTDAESGALTEAIQLLEAFGTADALTLDESGSVAASGTTPITDTESLLVDEAGAIVDLTPTPPTPPPAGPLGQIGVIIGPVQKPYRRIVLLPEELVLRVSGRLVIHRTVIEKQDALVESQPVTVIGATILEPQRWRIEAVLPLDLTWVIKGRMRFQSRAEEMLAAMVAAASGL